MVARAPRAKRPNTLAIDVGGTGIKASVLDPDGVMEHERVRVETPYPLSPQKLVLEIQRLIGQLPPFDRVSVGFPGMVRDGHILSAPHFISPSGPAGRPEPKLVKAWGRFDLAAALEEVTGRPTKVANDADLQGAAVVEGKGFEAVVTLGTGVGTSFFLEGMLLPHFEFAHSPLSKDGDYNEVLGEAARRRLGKKKWEKRVWRAVEILRELTFFDHCFIGGGNAARLGPNLPADVSIVSNTAGILGGIKLWERTVSAPPRPAPARKAPARQTPARKAPAARKGPVARKAATGPATIPEPPIASQPVPTASQPVPTTPEPSPGATPTIDAPEQPADGGQGATPTPETEPEATQAEHSVSEPLGTTSEY